jgi:polar amino acid transport system permease protein
MASVPLWLVAVAVILLMAGVSIVNDPTSQETLRVLRRGLNVTLRVTLQSFVLALLLGVAAGLARASGNRLAREVATFYVEVVRGVPMLVLLLWVGYGLAPWTLSTAREIVADALVAGWSFGGLLSWLDTALEPCRRPHQCLSFEARGIAGLGIGYGAYIAEVVRAGIESVGRGQREAALALGLSAWQTMLRVVLPQAMRVILPPLGNDFIALLKDSSLISVLAVPDLVLQARIELSRRFEAFGVWNLVALTYLVLTLVLSAGVRLMERRLGAGREQ